MTFVRYFNSIDQSSRSPSMRVSMHNFLMFHLRQRMARMTAYSMMAAKMLRMQVTTNVSMAFRLVEEEEGELALTDKQRGLAVCYLLMHNIRGLSI